MPHELVSLEWSHVDDSLALIRGSEVVYCVPVDEVFPLGPGTVEQIEMLRGTPYFTADVIAHLIAFLVEHDMALQEYLDIASSLNAVVIQRPVTF